MLTLPTEIPFNPFDDLPYFPATAIGFDTRNGIEKLGLAGRASDGGRSVQSAEPTCLVPERMFQHGRRGKHRCVGVAEIRTQTEQQPGHEGLSARKDEDREDVEEEMRVPTLFFDVFQVVNDPLDLVFDVELHAIFPRVNPIFRWNGLAIVPVLESIRVAE